MKKILVLIFLAFFTFDEAFSAVYIVTILPNPIGDDTLGEYIELKNTGCAPVDISHFSLSDMSGKSFIISETIVMGIDEKRQFPYSETKISLNNSGDETVTLKDRDGKILDIFSYSGTQKENIVLSVSLQNENCEMSEENTGSLSSSGVIFDSGGLVDTGSISSSGQSFTGYIDGEIQSGSTTSISGAIDNNSIVIPGTGIIDANSGTIIVSSGATNSGNTFEIQTGTTLDIGSNGTGASQGNLIPESLYYDDTDNNGKIDTFEIVYNFTLTGSVNLGQLFLYSKTGGLSSEKIDTSTGYFDSGYLSGNSLILRIKEGDLVKNSLKINNSVTSDLRIKSVGIIGITSLEGKPAENFFLTTSFESYKKVFSKRIGESEIGGTGATNSGSEAGINASGGLLHPLDFPEIIPLLQSPTNAEFSSGTFICNQVDCRINISFASLFGSGILEKNYTCSFATGSNILERDSDCNPNTYYFFESGSINVEIVSRITGNKYNQIFPVIFLLQNPAKISQNTHPENTVIDTGKPIAILALDGKWKDYYEQLGDYEMNCYAFTCSMNFTAEKSYDPEGNQIHFLWIYGRNDIKTTKDPGSIHYDVGDHRLILRVIDKAGNYDEIVYITHVLGPKPKDGKEKIEKKSVKASLKKISGEVKSLKKKFKKIKMEFFSLPFIVLQGKTGKKIQEDKYKCSIQRAKTCSINFTLSGALTSFEYRWHIDGASTFHGKNPPAWKLKPGNHTITLESYRKGATLATSKQTFTVSVGILPKKAKKATKSSKKTKKPSKKSLSIIPSVGASNSQNTENDTSSSPLAFFILSLGLGCGYLLRSKNKRNHSS